MILDSFWYDFTKKKNTVHLFQLPNVCMLFVCKKKRKRKTVVSLTLKKWFIIEKISLADSFHLPILLAVRSVHYVRTSACDLDIALSRICVLNRIASLRKRYEILGVIESRSNSPQRCNWFAYNKTDWHNTCVSHVQHNDCALVWHPKKWASVQMIVVVTTRNEIFQMI